MRLLFLLSSIALLTACTDRKDDETGKKSAATQSRYSALLAKCKPLQFDTLAVFSLSEPEDDDYTFKGVKIDSTDGLYLPAPIRQGLASEMYGTYACGSFPIDANHTGILLRTPGMYSSSTINFLLLDKAKDTITNVIELAQIFGDAGDFVEKKSWLFKNQENKPASFMWEVQTYDHSIGNEADPTIDRQDNYYLFNLLQPVKDTASTNAKDLFKTFERLDRK